MFGFGNTGGQYDDIIMQHIRLDLRKKLYLEGKNKEYYFGSSPLGDELTLVLKKDFYGIWRADARIITEILEELGNKYSLCKTASIDFKSSAFKVNASKNFFFLTKGNVFNDVDKPLSTWDKNYIITINVVEEGALEEAIAKEPERWKLFQDMLSAGKLF